MKTIVRKKVKSATTGFTPKIRSRHPSHAVLRGRLKKMPFTSVIRFGSLTEDTAKVELNSIDAIRNSSSKLRMKQCFTRGNVKTAQWYLTDGSQFFINGDLSKPAAFNKVEYPIVAKTHFGSRGEGNTLIKSNEDLRRFLTGKTLGNYIFEKFHNYTREYRLHVTEDGCFYTCRKMLKTDTPEDAKWFRNDSNCVWVVEENELFDRPVNWEQIETECVKALNSCGLDFGACDLRVQGANHEGKPRKSPDFIVVEINSAPSFGEVTKERYAEMLPSLLIKKSKK